MTQLYALVTNGTVVSDPALLPFSYGNIIGFNNITDEDELRLYGFYPFVDSEYEGTLELGQILDKTYVLVDNQVVPSFSVRSTTSFEIELAERKIRNTRDSKLTKSDWTQLPDNNLNDLAKAAWKKYRQELRNISDQENFPWEVTWPTEPVEPYTGIIPPSVTPLQMRKALRLSGLYESVQSYLATQDAEVNEEWEYATQIDRDNVLIATAAVLLGKTAEEVDDLFRLAATLS